MLEGEVSGRVFRKRNLGGLIFLVLLDGSRMLSLVCNRERIGQDVFSEVTQLRKGDYARLSFEEVDGQLSARRLLKHYHNVRRLDESTLEQTLRAYSFLLSITRTCFADKGYVEVRLPSIHYGQSTKDYFPIDFFGVPARLSRSNALYVDIAALKLCRAYSIQRCFRAEKSRTRRHLAEYDALEVAILDARVEDGMNVIEDYVREIVKCFAASEFASVLSPLIEQSISLPFRRISHQSVADSLGLRFRGLGCHETEVAGSTPVFVHTLPIGISSWAAEPISSTHAASFNLLLPDIGEVADGTQRDHDVTQLRSKINALRLEKQLGWYADSISFPGCRSIVFGLGLERLAMWLLGIRNIRKLQIANRDTSFSELGAVKVEK